MEWLEHTISALSPQWGYRRAAWRQASEERRSYDAARPGRSNFGWRTNNQSASSTDRMARDVLRARARDLERNSDIANGILRALERNVVGAGIRLQARVEGDEELNRRIEALWMDWCRPFHCDARQDQSFDELCRMIVRRAHVDGGILLLKRYVPGRAVPFCLQALEVDELDAGRMTPHSKGNRVVDGIEYNHFNQRQGYWIRGYDLDGNQQSEAEFIEANNAIFFWQKVRPSQLREITPLSPAMSRIRDIESTLEAVSMKERIGACLTVFIKRITPSPGGAGWGRQGSKLEDKSSGYDGKMISPGMIQELEPGDDIGVVNPPNQGGGAAEFVRLQQRLAASGQGLSYEAAARDLEHVTYSSARQGLIEDDGTYGIERKRLIDHVLREVYTTFLVSAVLCGAVSIPDFWSNKAKYLRHEWTPPGRRWIDPLKEAKADEIAMARQLKTFAQLCAESGRDWREEFEQMAKEEKYKNELGLTGGGEANAT